ncbi:hypothetical protein B0T19DRAFT_460078 [Cercophora scortea]|uniref:J domain-containing protein n=1 Tax=Cercophora scortea TaxID=314031 RepID=A0AAE0MDH3_9PEZI|nr:hypothetical protein B0T19DRAFT_460078 [Cercophora scortea]
MSSPPAPRDCYAVLGVSSSASQQIVVTAYKKLVVEKNPDKNGNTPEAHAAYAEIKNAWKEAKEDFIQAKRTRRWKFEEKKFLDGMLQLDRQEESDYSRRGHLAAVRKYKEHQHADRLLQESITAQTAALGAQETCPEVNDDKSAGDEVQPTASAGNGDDDKPRWIFDALMFQDEEFQEQIEISARKTGADAVNDPLRSDILDELQGLNEYIDELKADLRKNQMTKADRKVKKNRLAKLKEITIKFEKAWSYLREKHYEATDGKLDGTNDDEAARKMRLKLKKKKHEFERRQRLKARWAREKEEKRKAEKAGDPLPRVPCDHRAWHKGTGQRGLCFQCETMVLGNKKRMFICAKCDELVCEDCIGHP